MTPSDIHSLRERLRRGYKDFSPAQQALARYVADHLADLPVMSAHEVARAAHCSPATVVRFAQALGYGGYPELQQLVRRSQRPWLPPSPGDPSVGVFGGDTVRAQLAADRHSLDAISERLGQRGLTPLAQALVGRRPIIVAGDGPARPVVAVISDRLTEMGIASVAIDSTQPADMAWLKDIPSTSAMIAVGIGREPRVAQTAVRSADAAGVPVVALIDSTLSPIAGQRLARVVPADVRGGGPSLVAMVAVAQALCGTLEVAMRRQNPTPTSESPRITTLSA